ncbi:hypothetical protein FDA94_28575 [Herbidospora galbida]|uniref:Uncharacterized protein n=1 Tax=Herbidospora galbida TaxID=2575442 RepID=A0A4U3MA97_9ACTN|nr:hypothetical protein [Herbidospora galbida]TKK84587.1 hypothetical protein FDA94_28575 [Herbidospora galbida]
MISKPYPAPQTIAPTTYQPKFLEPLPVGNATPISTFTSKTHVLELVQMDEIMIAQLLSRQPDFQRPIDWGRVAHYASLIENDQLIASPDLALSFTTDGYVLQGRHRLLAAERVLRKRGFGTVAFYVNWNGKIEHFPFLDLGKPRTGRDILAMSDVEHPAKVAAALNVVYSFDSMNANREWRSLHVDPSRIDEVLKASYKDLPLHVTGGSEIARRLGLRHAAIIAGLYITSRVDQAAAVAFAEPLVTGAGLTVGSPQLVFSDWSLRRKTTRVRLKNLLPVTAHQLRAYIVAYNASITGIKLSAQNFTGAARMPKPISAGKLESQAA